MTTNHRSGRCRSCSGINDIQPGEFVIVLITDNPADITTFIDVWSPVIDLSGIQIGYTDGAGLGAGGDTVTLWLGDPNSTSPVSVESYPSTAGFDGQSYDSDLAAFSVVGNANGAVQTIALGGSNGDVPNIASPGNGPALTPEPILVITEIHSGQEGDDLTADWFEIENQGTAPWVSGTDPDLFYDDESQDPAEAQFIQGLSAIQPGEFAIVLITGDVNDLVIFNDVWSPVIDLSGVEIGYTDGAGLGGGGDTVTLWLGDPNNTTPVSVESYPDTVNNDGQSYDVDLGEFSVVGNANGAVETIALGGNNADVPNIGSPGNGPVVSTGISLVVTEIFSGQEGDDLTADWFEIVNQGNTPWISGVNGDLYYDDESQSPLDASIIQSIPEIQPGQFAIVLITSDQNEITTFTDVWSPVIDLTGVQLGYTDGSGLGGGGDAVTLWLGDPNNNAPVSIESYPDTTNNDGQSYDSNLNEFSVVGNANGAVETIALGGDNADVPNIGSPGSGPVIAVPEVNFANPYVAVDENGGSVIVEVLPSLAPGLAASIEVVVLSGGTAVEGTDFNYPVSQTLNFAAGSTDPQSISIPIVDNSDDGSDVFFVLGLQNENGIAIGGNDLFSVYILDDDTVVPAGDDSELNMQYVTSYLVDQDGTAEISAYDPITQRMYVINNTTLEILDFSDPNNIQPVSTVLLTGIGSAGQSVAVSNGLFAVAIAAEDPTDNGFVLIGDVQNTQGVTLEVGPLPDMLTFSPDGNLLVVANEGEPKSDYSVDPEGSVSIIDVSGGIGNIGQDDVTTVGFNAFDSQQAALEAAGVRIFGPGASVSQDLEPEYITISSDSQFAYVSLQENNAYAIVDLTVPEITDVIPFGLKDHSLFPNTIDVSDETDFVFDANWPIYGMYMPDGIDYYEVDGTGYIVTANEGDAREYDALEEEVKINDVILDPTVFTNIDILELDSNLSQINMTSESGDIDGDGDYDEIHVFGARSFSIFEAATGTLVYDSGNDFEVITANDPVFGPIFNATDDENEFKNRSDNKGPEPESVIVREIDGQFYAFVLLERIGGMMVYNVTDPANPVFLEYENSRDATPGGTAAGDLAPEGVVYISPADSPTGNGLIVLSNEVSATLSIYSIENDILSVNDPEITDRSFVMTRIPPTSAFSLANPEPTAFTTSPEG